MAKDLPKIKGVFTESVRICESLKQSRYQCDQNSIQISFVSASDTLNQNFDELDQTFMYTQILKEILFELEHEEESN